MKVFNEFLKVKGTAAERALFTDIAENTHVEFTETDTSDVYEWDGDSWVKTESTGQLLVRQNNDTSIYPVSWFLPVPETIAASTSTGVTVYESGDVSMYNTHNFTVTQGAGATSVDVLVSHDGTNYEAVQIQMIDRSVAVGSVTQSTNNISTAGNYYVDGKFKKIKIVQTGGSITTAYGVRGSHSVK